MNFGITAFNAHLNIRMSPPDFTYEIDWNAFKTWNNNKLPQFAGRYFLGQPYLWGHGEATDVFNGEKIPKIIPIQKADKDRQQATGPSGEWCGIEDAYALCRKITTCLDMNELSIPGKNIAVFLEVEEGTKLSGEYWSAWCSAVVGTIYVNVKQVEIKGTMLPKLTTYAPFLPCICCKFTKTAAGKYALDSNVKTCLENPGKKSIGKYTRCYGFWARATDIPEYHVPEPSLDWTKFELYEQPQGEVAKVPVPVLFWRYMDSVDPATPGMDQFDKITLDAAPPAVVNSVLEVKDWKLTIEDPDRNDAVRKPVSFGIDRGRSIMWQIEALAKKEMRIRELPSTYSADGVKVDLRGKPTFVGRYYSGRPTGLKDLLIDEAKKISAQGIEIVTFFQGKAEYHQVPNYLLSNLHPNQGKLDALAACTYAAEVIRQPAHTPIYFCVDSLVMNAIGATQILKDKDGNPHTVPVPTVTEIAMYFRDVNEGYDDYLKQRKAADLDPIPYYIGVYASRNVLDMLYIQGLATHFWQAWPIRWGDDEESHPNLKVWPHNNVWQVLIWEMRPRGDWGSNADIEAAAGNDGVDFNIAWGDTGGWKKKSGL